MNVLAIGATGFIGLHVVRRLTQAGHRIAVFHRGETEADLPDSVLHIHGNRDALPEHRKAFERFAPDVVLDVVPYTEIQARQTAEVFTGLANRLVVLSSSDVYRNYDGWRGKSNHPPDPAPLNENAPLRETLYPYRGYDGLDFEYAEDYDKMLVERAVMEASGLAVTVLRLPAVYGPGDAQHRFAAYLKRMMDERPFILLGDEQARWRWTHGYVENVAAAIACAVAMPRAADRVYNLGEFTTPTEKERIEKLGEVVGWSGEVIALPDKELPDHLQTGFDWTYDLATDTRRIRDELGFNEPIAWDKALERTVMWEQSRLSQTVDEQQFDYAAEDEAVA